MASINLRCAPEHVRLSPGAHDATILLSKFGGAVCSAPSLPRTGSSFGSAVPMCVLVVAACGTQIASSTRRYQLRSSGAQNQCCSVGQRIRAERSRGAAVQRASSWRWNRLQRPTSKRVATLCVGDSRSIGQSSALQRMRRASNVASILCALDCTILPALMILLPLAGLASPANLSRLHELSHLAALYIVLPIGGIAAFANYLSLRRLSVSMFALVGLTLIYTANSHSAAGLLPAAWRHAVHCGPAHRLINLFGCLLLLGSNYVAHKFAHKEGKCGHAHQCSHHHTEAKDKASKATCDGSALSDALESEPVVQQPSSQASRNESGSAAAESKPAKVEPFVLGGVEGLAEHYDAFLLDQFGVIHDGKVAYPGAVETLSKLAATGKPIVVVSNSSKRSGATRGKLNRMGFDTSGIVSIVTSGDVVHDVLREHFKPSTGSMDPAIEKFIDDFPMTISGNRAVVFGNDSNDNAEYCSSCGIEPVDSESADFVLARGTAAILTGPNLELLHADERSASFTAEMKRCVARSLPMLVANPDLVRPDGDDTVMPGALAAEYEAMGGIAHYVGKPYRMVYDIAMHSFPDDIDSSRVCAIGDVMYTDVLGANSIGAASVLVAWGVHHAVLGVPEARTQAENVGSSTFLCSDQLDGFLREYEYRPTHAVAKFAW